jgi:hypothetical protein
LTRARILAAAALVMAGLAATPPVAVVAADPGSYADSVDRALQVLRDAPDGDRDAARRAADVIRAGTGQSQREVLADLDRDPPDLADARARLAALARADRSPIFAPEPGRASSAVDRILSQPRYSPIQAGPSLGDRVRDALLQLAARLLDYSASFVSGRYGIALVALSLAVLALVLVVVARGTSWIGGGPARVARAPAAVTAARDRFAEADRQAATGDLARAVRSLAGGVAAALGDDRDWDASPLTVRELFSRAPDPPALRPLLAAFESAAYGARQPEPDAYARAAAAADPFRRPAGGRA